MQIEVVATSAELQAFVFRLNVTWRLVIYQAPHDPFMLLYDGTRQHAGLELPHSGSGRYRICVVKNNQVTGGTPDRAGDHIVDWGHILQRCLLGDCRSNDRAASSSTRQSCPSDSARFAHITRPESARHGKSDSWSSHKVSPLLITDESGKHVRSFIDVSDALESARSCPASRVVRFHPYHHTRFIPITPC